MSQLRAAGRFCHRFLRKHRGQPTSREHEIADCPKDHGKENDSKYSLSRFHALLLLSVVFSVCDQADDRPESLGYIVIYPKDSFENVRPKRGEDKDQQKDHD